VAEGQPATFSVVSVGTAPVTYQWQVAPSGYNANNIPNSNAASYTIASALRATSGYRFRCIVTNAYGTETSAFATLTVTAGSPVTVPEADRGRENRAVRFELAQSSDVHMTLHSLDGRAVHDVLHARFGAGTHAVAVPAVRTASGLFLCRVKTRQGNAVVPCFQPR
jgi:hypothetical protein